MRVLYLHPAAAFGGASKSLIELFALLREKGVEGTVLAPSGPLCAAFRQAGLQVQEVRGLSQFDNTRFSHYRGLRWLILLRELFLLPFCLWALWRLRHERYDLIHANEITLLPMALVAKWLLRTPLIVHVRSLQRPPTQGWRTRWTNVLLRRHADGVVAIDHTVAATLDPSVAVQVIHNGLRLSVESVPQHPSGPPVTIGFLGVLIPLKGIYELLQAMRLLKERGVALHLLVAGENARKLSGLKAWLLARFGFAKDVKSELEQIIQRDGLEQSVTLLGFVADVRSLYPQLDILCFPSHLNAAGRPVFEAAFHGIPSVVAVRDPMPDAVLHETTGLAIPEPAPALIADALQRLAEDPELRQRLGAQARNWAEQTFAVENNAARMLELYQSIVSSRERP